MDRVAVRHAGSGGDAAGASVAGRYQLEQELARGGMGCVYLARDLSTGRQVALKRLLDGASGRGAMLALFEREYRTLRSLKHPRIIDVYEYGVDAAGPYYTMELLPGTDLGKLAPLPYQKACAYLRDVASCLALLHARKLLHRDVSPYNARVSESGRCKLLDFGALSGFGVPSQVVGTAPCIPPEAVRGAPLDQRADLYALGATAYYLLTRRHAFPAKTIAELARVWQSAVPRPSQYAPDVPPALDDLVLSLLHPDPLARPESAAEVIDRLNAIASLPADDEPQAAASYLFSTALVAREAQLEAIQTAIRDAAAGHGTAVLIEGPSGSGRTRLLLEAGVQAQLAGATVLQVDAAADLREHGTALALARMLLDAAPEEATRAAEPHAAILARLMPAAAPRLSVSEPAAIPEAPGEWRGRAQAALTAWLAGVSETKLLVIAIDNLEAADDASSALFAALAAAAPERKLLLLAALRRDALAQQPSGLRFLRDVAVPVSLAPLGPDDAVLLARAMFGEVPNVLAFGKWLYGASQGLLSHAFELASDLARRGVVKYVAGTWVLPQDARTEALPSGIADALEQRIARLAVPALELAQALAVLGAPAGIELCRAVADAMGMDDVFARVDALVEGDVLLLAGDRYRFRHEGLCALLLQRVRPEQRQRLHRAMGQALLATAAPDDRMARVEAGWQLLRGGEELRGAQLLERTAREFEIGTGSLQAAIPALEEARRVYHAHGRSLYELLPVVARLATEGYYSDRRLSTLYAAEAFALLRKATGLDLADRLRPLLGRKLGVYAGLCWAALRFFAMPPSRRMARFDEIFVLLVNCVTTQAGAGAVCLDTEAMRRAAAFIEPLTVLGPRHITSAIHEYCQCLMQMSLERQPEVRAGWLALLQRLSDHEQFKALPEYVRQLYVGGALFALGIVETWRDGQDALARAHELESLGLRIYDRAANQVRMLYYAAHGELERAELYRRRMELHAVQTGSAWQVEVTVPLTQSTLYAALGDVVGLKRATEQIEQIAARLGVSSLARSAKLARASHLVVSGSHEAALALYEEVLAGVAPRSFVGWARSLGSAAEAYNQLGRHAEALRLCEEALVHVRAEDRPFTRMFLALEVQRALAEAGLGRIEQAAQRLAALLAEHEQAGNPLTLGALHEARAQVALIARDRDGFERHLRELDRCYRPTQVPGLIARVERLAQRGNETLAHARVRVRSLAPVSHVTALETARSLLLCSDLRERAARALALVLQESGAPGGHLFLVDAAGALGLAASRGAPPPPDALHEAARAVLAEFGEDAQATRLDGESTVPTVVARKPPADGEFRTHLLWCVADGEPRAVGVLAVREAGETRPLEFHLLQAVAESLRAEPGDTAAAPAR